MAAVSPYAIALIGLAGSLIGGMIAGGISILIAREARAGAHESSFRDSLSHICAGFLANSQALLDACWSSGQSPQTDASRAAVKQAHLEFFEVYGVLQTLAGQRL